MDLLTLLCTKLFPFLEVQITSYLPSMSNVTPQGWGVQQREYISIVMSLLAFRPAVLRQGFLVVFFVVFFRWGCPRRVCLDIP